jgi:hypothetical protein
VAQHEVSGSPDAYVPHWKQSWRRETRPYLGNWCRSGLGLRAIACRPLPGALGGLEVETKCRPPLSAETNNTEFLSVLVDELARNPQPLCECRCLNERPGWCSRGEGLEDGPQELEDPRGDGLREPLLGQLAGTGGRVRGPHVGRLSRR